MQNYEYFHRPPPPPRSTVHLWLGVLLCGFSLGLGAFYIDEQNGGPAVRTVMVDLNARQWPSVASTTQINNLLADVKDLMEELGQTRRALTAAEARIAALEQENGALRQASLSVEGPTVPEAALETEPEGMGGPLIRAPEAQEKPAEKPREIAAKSSGLRACWMRGGSMVSIYRIAVRDDGFTLAPAFADDGQGAWPEEFGPVMTGFPGHAVTAEETVSRAEFKKIMRPYFNHGMRQEARCRFLVAVRDETSSREAWASGLALVERYFFKKIRGGGEEIALGAR